MQSNKKMMLAFGLALSVISGSVINNMSAMECNITWRDIEKELKSVRHAFDPTGAFMGKLGKLELLDESIIAHGVSFSEDVNTSINLIFKENLLRTNPLAVINSLDNLIEKLNNFIGKIEKSLNDTDELIAKAKRDNNIVITKEELKLRLKTLSFYSSTILLELKSIINLIQRKV